MTLRPRITVLAGWLALLAASLAAPTSVLAQTAARIEQLVSAATVPGMSRPDFRDYQPSVRKFYAASANAPAWVQGKTPSAQAVAMIQAFKDAWQKGLTSEDYDASRWDARQQQLQRSDADLAGFDVALTVSAMRYVSDLHIGRINPKHVEFALPVEQKKYDLAEFLRTRLLTATDTPSVIASVEPPFAGYQRTEAALRRYADLARQDDGEKLPVPAKAIEPGQPYAGLPRLARFLRLVGDLPAEPQGAAAPQIYEGALVEAVKRFQRRHGLDQDGRLGPSTVKQLNVPLTERVRQLQLTLERWRWLPEDFSTPPIVVNIPDFRLRALDDKNAVALDMRVVVGKAMKTETPVFTRDMAYVVFRPYWVVPPGIMRRSILPSIQKNREYIANNRYEITTHDGKFVTSGTVTDELLAQLRAGKLAVRQKPGPKNALGLVKLIFPNEHQVYLHSTPSTELFARTRRDFSAGCIRVEKPAELTAWALRDNNQGWTVERVQEAMDSGRDNVTVRLTRPVPVFIVYGTAIGYPDDEVHFYDDIYGHDARLAAALAARG
jgi:murein L,D-transpeptidase YcbB/YkuD